MSILIRLIVKIWVKRGWDCNSDELTGYTSQRIDFCRFLCLLLLLIPPLLFFSSYVYRLLLSLFWYDTPYKSIMALQVLLTLRTLNLIPKSCLLNPPTPDRVYLNIHSKHLCRKRFRSSGLTASKKSHARHNANWTTGLFFLLSSVEHAGEPHRSALFLFFSLSFRRLLASRFLAPLSITTMMILLVLYTGLQWWDRRSRCNRGKRKKRNK